MGGSHHTGASAHPASPASQSEAGRPAMRAATAAIPSVGSRRGRTPYWPPCALPRCDLGGSAYRTTNGSSPAFIAYLPCSASIAMAHECGEA